jgi:hypothetical protein
MLISSQFDPPRPPNSASPSRSRFALKLQPLNQANGTARRTWAEKPAETALSPWDRRRAFVLLLRSMWAYPAVRRSTLPVAVNLNRFAIAFLVFIMAWPVS